MTASVKCPMCGGTADLVSSQEVLSGSLYLCRWHCRACGEFFGQSSDRDPEASE